jgi:hypothetical protein
MFQEALESRLRAIEDEITRLLRLSAEVGETEQQDNYLRLAQDLQREARELRSQIKKETQPKSSAGRESRAKKSCFVLSGLHSQGL